MKLLLIAVPITVAVGWWLSGYDPKVSGQDRNADFARRASRVAISLLFVVAGWSWAPLWIAAAIFLALIWTGCASELFSGGFHKLVDAADDREFDPARVSRDQDELAALVKNRHAEQAIALCEKMKSDGDASGLAIDAQLFHLYSHVLAGSYVPVSPPLVEAEALCAQGRFSDAETKLNLLLKDEPDNSIASVVLMRIYGRDLKSLQKAEPLFQRIAHQPKVPAAFIAHAREMLLEWRGVTPPKEKQEHGIETLLYDAKFSSTLEPVAEKDPVTVDEMLAAGQLATAIELLDKQVREQPGDFEGWLKLAEAHGFYCRDLRRAGKIVAKMEASSSFNPEQIRLAKAKLREWQDQAA
jgi:hypothetical protein